MYANLLNILVEFLGTTAGTLQYSVCEVLATCGCVFVLLIPFIIVYKVICLLVG